MLAEVVQRAHAVHIVDAEAVCMADARGMCVSIVDAVTGVDSVDAAEE